MIHSKLIKALSLGAVLITSSLVKAEPLALNQVIDYALTHEPWLQANKYQQQAIEAQSIAAGTLPDPVLTVGLMNLPTDGFAFDQEGMTQFKVGLSQQFSRGDSLALQQQALKQSAEQYPWLRADRQAQVKALFNQLIDITEASYANTLGATRQQDIIRAQLELTRLEDKLVMLEQQFDSAKKRLAQWLPIEMLNGAVSDENTKVTAVMAYQELAPSGVTEVLMNHPAIIAIDHAMRAKNTQVQVAKEAYKPQFGMNLGLWLS